MRLLWSVTCYFPFFRIRRKSNSKLSQILGLLETIHTAEECTDSLKAVLVLGYQTKGQRSNFRSLILSSSKVKSGALVNHSWGHDNEDQLLLLEWRTVGLDARAKAGPVTQYSKSKSFTIPPSVQLILSTALGKEPDIPALLRISLTKLIGFVRRTGIARLSRKPGYPGS